MRDPYTLPGNPHMPPDWSEAAIVRRLRRRETVAEIDDREDRREEEEMERWDRQQQ